MSSKRYKQDMPPTGGFDPINYNKILRGPTKFWKIFAAFFLVPIPIFVTQYVPNRRRRDKEDLEMQDGRIAIVPFLVAENMRTMMKQLVKNREAERELMKDNPYWEVGKLYKEPVFHNLRGRFIAPDYHEYYMHSHPDAIGDRAYIHVHH